MPRPRLCQLRKRDRGRQRFPDDEGFAEGGRMNRPWRRPTTEQAPGSKRRPPCATMWTKLEDAPPPVKQASHRTNAVGPAHGRDPQGQRGAGGRPPLGRGRGRSR